MAEKVVVHSVANNTRLQAQPVIVSLRCPYCGREGSFEGVGVQDRIGRNQVGDKISAYNLGIRRCPYPQCYGAIFYQVYGDEITTYPAQRIDFDTTDIPDGVAKCLTEAIDCHANGDDVAAAIMVRKTLEEMCAEKGGVGRDLKDRIKNLGSKIVIPQELLSGMDSLRLLGNDAAHIEARTFADVGTKELEVAIKFTKELMKSVYQYGSLLRELEDLKAVSA